MDLITFQPESALKELVNQGCLACNPQFVDTGRYDWVYNWVAEHMRKQVGSPQGIRYPVWCWVKFKSGICPPRHKGKPEPEAQIKITFSKPREEVFITDYRRYSFLLNHRYIPASLEDKRRFEDKLSRAGLEKDAAASQPYQNYPEIDREIVESFQRCVTTESDVLQGCVWRLFLSDVQKIEFLRDRDYQYGTFNYLRKNGSRFNWIEDFYKHLR